MLGLALGFAAYNYCFYLFLTWLPSYFTGALHLNLQASVLYTSIPWLFATATDLLVGGWLVDELIRRGFNDSGVRQVILIEGMVMGLSLLGTIFTHDTHGGRVLDQLVDRWSGRVRPRGLVGPQSAGASR